VESKSTLETTQQRTTLGKTTVDRTKWYQMVPNIPNTDRAWLHHVVADLAGSIM